MKFSHSLALNASPAWTDHYISYSRLKKIIYMLEKATLGSGKIPGTTADLELYLDENATNRPQSPLLKVASGQDGDEMDAPLLIEEPSITNYPKVSLDDTSRYFLSILDQELDKVCSFYSKMESELFKDLRTLAFDITKAERQEESYLHSLWNNENTSPALQRPSRQVPPIESPPKPGTNNATSALDQFDSPLMERRQISSHTSSLDVPIPGFLPYLIWSSASLKFQAEALSKRAIELYVRLCELRDFADINETGFGKVLKKYDKVLGANMREQYMQKVLGQIPFMQSSKDNIELAIEKLVQWYARIATDGKIKPAEAELRTHLKEHVVWERNNIWLDMVEQERRTETIGFRSAGALGVPKAVTIHLCNMPIKIPREISGSNFAILGAILALILISNSSIFPTPEQNNCFAILIFATILWAFEAIPLFVTSMIIPALIVAMRVMVDEKGRLPSKPAAKLIFSGILSLMIAMFGPVIMLLLGGFSLAAALSKHHIAKSMASKILERAGSRPSSVLLANMFVSTFASMWISNVAAPVLCFSLISVILINVQPILRNLPHRSRYARCLVLGIAMAANVGGMASPIASPQNVIAIGIMDPAPSWIQWLVIAIPVCIITDLFIWALLLVVYRPNDSSVAPPEMYSHRHSEKFTVKQNYIITVTVITIMLWCFESILENIVGDMGIIAIFPMVAFFGTGILTKDDWNSMLWSVVMLAMGGVALGKAVESCGLLKVMAEGLTTVLNGNSVFLSICIVSGVVVVITSFISHTVGALIILPVISKIGALLPDPQPRTLVMITALMCSGGMSLPVSSFPNMNAISLEDSRGVPWLTVNDFLMVGIASSAIAWFFGVTIGYPIMNIIDFN